MSNLEIRPAETRSGGVTLSTEPELLAPREVPLGGPRAMTVRRTLPHRHRRMVGAWCFIDHYGPHDITGGPGMQVPPHPHTGLQTVSWLFEGAVLHNDSLGSSQRIEPGQLNLMTAGHGISHSEQSLITGPASRRLHGLQLWVALPEASRSVAPSFEHHAALPVLDDGVTRVEILMGSLTGAASPATTYSPLLGADVTISAGGETLLPVEPDFEHALLVTDGAMLVDGRLVERASLLYLPPGTSHLLLSAEVGARGLLIGGEPFEEQIVMWWNFVGSDHNAVADARADWETRSARFGTVTGYPGGRLSAPPLPNARLRARGRTRNT